MNMRLGASIEREVRNETYTVRAMISQDEQQHLHRAIELAMAAEREGNLPIGAVITLNNKVISEGKNGIWNPTYDGNRHAEIEALRAVPNESWPKSREMTLYTTLEPCLMCTGAILLHHIGRAVFGANDPVGGGMCVFGSMPSYLEHELKRSQWMGPASPGECTELFSRAVERIAKRKEAGLIL